MERQEIERIMDRVSCGVVLEQAGFQIDLKESTCRAVKYRRGSEIAIVTHEGRGWFDPLSDRKGDVFSLHAWPKLFEKRRRVVLGASMMAIHGKIQREGAVLTELAEFHLSPLRNTAPHHCQILDEKIDIA